MNSVLIVKLGAIGDVIMAVSAVQSLAEPGVTIDWICGKAVAPLLACFSWINPIVVDDQALLTGSAKARLSVILDVWKLLAGRRYGLCATLYYDPRYKLLTLPVRAERRITLDPEDRNRRILPGRSHAEELERILLGLEDGYREHSVSPAAPDRLPASPLAPRQSPVRIALVPAGASNMLRQQTLRRWPLEHYVELASRLLDRGHEVVLIGGPGDAWAQSAFDALRGQRLQDTIGTLTLPEVVAAFSACDLVVSHDTGPLHLAGLSTAPIVAIFGPTDPASFLPRRAGVRALWGGETLACRPCYDGRDFAPCQNNACVREVTVAMVLNHIDDLLPERRAPWRILQPSSLAAKENQ